MYIYSPMNIYIHIYINTQSHDESSAAVLIYMTIYCADVSRVHNLPFAVNYSVLNSI